MTRATDLALTALAPAVWGSTYLVTTELLSGWHPITVALLRALPAGLLLLLLVRRLPKGAWWSRAFVLGSLNFSIFWVALFVSAYRLPGGVAATVGAVQPLVVIGLARLVLGTPVSARGTGAAMAGMAGVAMMVLAPGASLDPLGVIAGLAGAIAMAAGTVMSRLWSTDVPPLAATAWQMVAGGLLLLPVAAVLAPLPASPSPANLAGLAWLGLAGGAVTYVLWFRGIGRLGPTAVAPLGLLSPATAVLLGWLVLGETLTAMQILGVTVVAASIMVAQTGATVAGIRHPPSPPGASG